MCYISEVEMLISSGTVLNRRPYVMIRFVCKLCGEEIDVRDELAGRQMECTKCKSIRVVPDKSPKLKFHCKSCGQKVRVDLI